VSGLILKALFVLGLPNPFPGAGWTRIGFFAENWSKKGHEVDVLGTFSYTSFRKMGAETFGKVNIFNFIFNMGIDHPFVFTINSLVSFIVTTLFLITSRPKIAIVSVPRGDVGLGALMACRLLEVKYVVDYRDEWEDYAVSRVSHRIETLFYSAVKSFACCLYAKSRSVITVTSNFMKALRRRGLTNVKLIPNGADARTFRPLVDTEARKLSRIFYSGGVDGYYRVDIAVKSIKRLVESGLRNIMLVIVGTGEVQKVLDLAARLGISSNVEYLGEINDRVRLAEFIAGADVGLIPYDDNPLWRNSLPAKLYEYCACGIPVIATAYTDSLLAEFIREYRIGITTPPMNEEKLAEAIYWMYQNRIFREAAGKRARLLIEEKFDRNKIAEEFFNLLRASI
jgi:glycosyltransferase involved in cell wall biosynthesis